MFHLYFTQHTKSLLYIESYFSLELSESGEEPFRLSIITCI